jgi:hypothetical protein
MSNRKITILDRKYEIPGLDHLFNHEGKLRKLWQEIRNPACKTAVNWVTRNKSRMVRKEHLKNGKQSWQTAKSHLKQYGLMRNPLQKWGELNASSAIHSYLSPIFYRIHKANIIALCLENQFRAHDLWDCDHRLLVGAQAKTLLATVDEGIPVNFRP